MSQFPRACLALLTVSFCVPLTAQWIHYPTAGIPRTPDGKPKLDAPAPRTRDRKPDLSGMWMNSVSLPCPAMLKADDGSCAERNGVAPEEANIGRSLPGGLPYTPWAIDEMKRRKANLFGDDPHVRCLPPSFPRAWGLPHITKLIQIPGELAILDEYNASYRQIFTDGRPLPVDPQPSWQGYSTAHWDGDALVVTTTGFRDDIWLDSAGSPLTDAGKMTERIRRPNFGTLLIDLTIEDAKAYTRPWTIHLKQGLVVDTEMIDEICLENEQSIRHLPLK